MHVGFQKKETFSDIKLILSDKTIPAHKELFSLNSDKINLTKFEFSDSSRCKYLKPFLNTPLQTSKQLVTKLLKINVLF